MNWRGWILGGADLNESKHARNFGMIAVLILAGATAGCHPRGTPEAGGKSGGGHGAVPVLATKAVEMDVPIEVQAIGNVQAFSRVSVRSRITGELQRIYFQEGQEVHAGDLLFTIDPRPSQAALQQAQANLARDQAQADNAKVEFGREKKLFDSGLVSHDEYDKVRANLAALEATVLADRAAVSNAALNVEYTAIRSPIEGRTGNQLVHEGNIVKAEDDVLININQIHPIYVSFAVPEQELPLIKARMAKEKLWVTSTFPNLESAPPKGELTFIDNSVDPTTGTIQLKATFRNEENLLWPGQFVQVALRLATQQRAVVVPSQAVQTGQNGQFVFVVKSDQSVEFRPVVEGVTREGRTVLEKGLQPGETVVTDGQLRLVPGVSKVKIQSPGTQLQTAAIQTNSM